MTDATELQRRMEGVESDMDELRAKLRGLSREYAELTLQKLSAEAADGRIAA